MMRIGEDTFLKIIFIVCFQFVPSSFFEMFQNRETIHFLESCENHK